MQKLSDLSRRIMLWSGIVLLLWALVDLANQSATITTSIADSGYRAYRDGVLSFQQFLIYLPWKVLWLPLFLLACVALGAFAIFTRRRIWLHLLMVPLAIAALVITLDTPLLFRWLGIGALWRILNSFKIISLALVALGTGLHLYCLLHLRKRRQVLKGNNAPGVRRWQQYAPPSPPASSVHAPVQNPSVQYDNSQRDSSPGSPDGTPPPRRRR